MLGYSIVEAITAISIQILFVSGRVFDVVNFQSAILSKTQTPTFLWLMDEAAK